MREVLINETKIKVRGLMAPEIEQLKKDKLPITRFGVDTARMIADLDLAEKMANRVFDIVLAPEDREKLEEGPNNKTIEIWHAILDETYGNPVEEKNL